MVIANHRTLDGCRAVDGSCEGCQVIDGLATGQPKRWLVLDHDFGHGQRSGFGGRICQVNSFWNVVDRPILMLDIRFVYRHDA